jgi:hypothetical protein
VPHAWLPSDQGLDNKIVYAVLQSLNIMTLLLDGIPNGSERPFVTLARAFCTLILLVVRRILINCIVSQVHKHVVKIFKMRLLVRYSGKPCEAFFKNIDSHWVDSIE